MLRVGIITMHKVQNFGSALQAYALQYVINRMGYESELIDYTYPNMEHCAYQNTIVDFRAVGISKMLRIIGSKIIRRLKKQPDWYTKSWATSLRRCTTVWPPKTGRS